jgi:hypothetical protein
MDNEPLLDEFVHRFPGFPLRQAEIPSMADKLLERACLVTEEVEGACRAFHDGLFVIPVSLVGDQQRLPIVL